MQACSPSASRAFSSGLSSSLFLAHKAVSKCLPDFGEGGSRFLQNVIQERNTGHGHRSSKRKLFPIHSNGESGDPTRSILLINKDLKLQNHLKVYFEGLKDLIPGGSDPGSNTNFARESENKGRQGL